MGSTAQKERQEAELRPQKPQNTKRYSMRITGSERKKDLESEDIIEHEKKVLEKLLSCHGFPKL